MPASSLDRVAKIPNSLCQTPSLLKNPLSFSLSLQDETLFGSFSLVDQRLLLSLWLEYSTSLDSLRFWLPCHRLLDFRRGLDVFDLVSKAVDAPLLTSLVECLADARVQACSLLEGPVELKLSDLTPHAGLGQERQGSDWFLHIVAGIVAINDFVVEHSIDFDLHVVFCDGMLGVYLQKLLLETVLMGHDI